uniref:Uncharacterized protein n=1 Tax=uncultured bacterium contig00033 TaxID=1181522 RepID=A0A806K0W6_9BACT|nr:hypothetical protein [uncultured bacterium contig00033]
MTLSLVSGGRDNDLFTIEENVLRAKDVDSLVAGREYIIKVAIINNQGSTSKVLSFRMPSIEEPGTDAPLTISDEPELVQSEEIIVQGSSLAEKLDWLRVFVNSNGNYAIEVGANESVPSHNFMYSGKNNIIITIRGDALNRTVNSNFTVGSGVTLVLGNNIAFRGPAAGNGLISVASGGRLIMNNGSLVAGNAADYQGDGVSINGGAFTMNGGEISGNRGNGVGMNGGTFTMNGGTISGNSSRGVNLSFNTGTITMNGGNISDNKGGGVSVGRGTFIMRGGTIAGNSTASFSRDYPVYGGGVSVINSGTAFTMNGGTISNNTASGGFGGGVYVYNGGIFNMNGGEISGNTAAINNDDRGRGSFGGSGGGLYIVGGGTFRMSNGDISKNNAHAEGGGIYADSIFAMSGGTVSGNTAREYGGGVYVRYGGIFNKTGGTIFGYASDANNGNAVKESSGTVRNFRGHAVYAGSSDNVLKIKETTSGPENNMSFGAQPGQSNYSPAFSGAWDN